jgi:Ca2+-binding EF-hand superfamily protein
VETEIISTSYCFYQWTAKTKKVDNLFQTFEVDGDGKVHTATVHLVTLVPSEKEAGYKPQPFWKLWQTDSSLPL